MPSLPLGEESEAAEVTDPTSDLVSFLEVRITMDENAARWLVEAYERDLPRPPARLINYNALVDPERLLRECEAKWRIIELHRGRHECSQYDHHGDVDNCTWNDGGDCSTLRLLALPYSDHPEYRSEWRPE